jgi:chemotaxis protein histidine kinase CheA
VRHFVKSRGGSVEVENEENVGTVFRIRLPLTVAE